jgi:hypothetical protein
MKLVAVAVTSVLALSSLAGCTTTRAERGALIGGAAGAAVGGLATNSAGGALVGGAVGATAGYVIAKNSYPCWRRNIFGQRYRGLCFR